MPATFRINLPDTFFDGCISVEGVRPNLSAASDSSVPEPRRVAGTFKACVFDNGFADPAVDTDTSTNIRTFSVNVRAGDWRDHKPPQIGDRLRYEDIPLEVSRVDSITGDVWSFTAREVGEW